LEAAIKAVKSRFPSELGEKNSRLVRESYQKVERESI
jgi:Pyruvate/2-oxoacid:ferredoxin oxidoreductase gamma subunit